MNLVTVNDASNAFGDRQLTVDVIADNLLWDLAKTSKKPDEDLLPSVFFFFLGFSGDDNLWIIYG